MGTQKANPIRPGFGVLALAVCVVGCSTNSPTPPASSRPAPATRPQAAEPIRPEGQVLTTGVFNEEASAAFHIVALDGQTYFEIVPYGVYLGTGEDIREILSPALVQAVPGAKQGTVTGLAATITPFKNLAFRAKAGPDGMHAYVDILRGPTNLGHGLAYDIRRLGREVRFAPGVLKVREMRGDTVVGYGTYEFADDACIGPSGSGEGLYMRGIQYSYEPAQR